ncbi:Glycoprotein-N-acetylgalactosamine 3-beta-galactosyltransferase [Bertholletia excelsa]
MPANATITTQCHHDKDGEKKGLKLTSRKMRRGCLQRRTSTAATVVVALLISTAAWLLLVFSGTSSRCWYLVKNPEASPSSCALPPPHSLGPDKRSSQVEVRRKEKEEEKDLSLEHIVFGIAGSSQLWKRRKEFIRLWWRPGATRGYVWLEEQVLTEDGDDELPPIIVSEDISRFRYTNPTGHPSGLRIARIIAECFRLRLPNVRWFILGDDDTIFNTDNLVAVLSKYDPSEMVYIGSPSESHSANSYFSHSMAFGGGGIAISLPLAEALSTMQDECLERYPKLYGSDDRLHACITELGIPLTRENGFHQFDIRGNAHGLLSSHPIAPFVSMHHVEAVSPFYPGLNTLNSLKLFTRAMRLGPRSILQRAICYDRRRHLTLSVSLGYAIQVFPIIVYPRELERSELTYSAWNRISHRNEFDFDTRDPYKSICKKPILFFLKGVGREGNATLGFYKRARENDDLRRKVFCFPRRPPLQHVQNIQVLGYPLSKNWHLAPRRLCCKLNQTSNQFLRLTVRQCEKGAFSAVTDSL